MKKEKGLKFNSIVTFFEKMVFLEVKEFPGFHGDLKIITKRVNPSPLSCTEDCLGCQPKKRDYILLINKIEKNNIVNINMFLASMCPNIFGKLLNCIRA